MIYSHEDRSGEEDLSKAGKLQLSAVELSHMVRVPSVRTERGFRVVSRFNRPGGRHHTHIETLYIEISYRGKIGRQDQPCDSSMIQYNMTTILYLTPGLAETP